MINTEKTLWKEDSAHTDVVFKVKHMMISTVSGNFTDFHIIAKTDGEDFTNAHFEFSAKINSIHTKNTDRDNHLKSADFFDAENHPELKFISKSFDGETLIGDMTIRGTTKELKLDVDFNGTATDPYGQTKAGMEISGELNRKDFGLNWNSVTEAGNIVVSDKVRLSVDAQLIKQES